MKQCWGRALNSNRCKKQISSGFFCPIHKGQKWFLFSTLLVSSISITASLGGIYRDIVEPQYKPDNNDTYSSDQTVPYLLKLLEIQEKSLVSNTKLNTATLVERVGKWDLGKLGLIAINGTFLYVITYDSQLKIIDVSNISKPKVMGSTQLPKFTSSRHRTDIHFHRGYLYLINDEIGMKIEIVDVRNPMRPAIGKGFAIPSASAINKSLIYESEMYVHYWRPGVKEIARISLSDPEKPRLISVLKTKQQSEAIDIQSDKEFIYLLYEKTGLELIEKKLDGSLISKSVLLRNGWFKSLAIDHEKRLIVGEWSLKNAGKGSLLTYAINENFDFELVSFTPTSDSPEWLMVVGEFLLYGARGLVVGKNVGYTDTVERNHDNQMYRYVFKNGYLFGVNANGLKILKLNEKIKHP